MSSPPPSSGEPKLGVTDVMSHLGVMVAVAAVLGLLVGGLAVPFAGALGFASKSAASSLQRLPKELRTAPLSQRSKLVSRDGKVIATFYDQNRVNVSLKQIAPIMRKAIVAIEDDRFYEHGALDLKGTLRAFVTNQAGGATVQGGSSITQQMAKLTELAQARTAAERKAATADTYQRKILELRHAIAFEQQYSKDWILNRYLNIAYFGDGAYGIQAAARHYFSRDAKNLNLRQSALLAGLVKNPVGFDPTAYPKVAEARRNVVLDRMAQLNIISEAEAKRVDGRKLGLRVSQARNGCLSSAAPFFCDYAKRYLMADPALGKTVADREQLLNSGGLTIKTTVDPRYQKAASKAVRAHVYPTDQAIGALAMVQPGTGNVRAIAQSRPMGRNKKLGQTFLNYVVPSDLGDSQGFQGGSTFKLFVLSAALEQGISPQTRIRSPQTITVPQNSFPDCDGNYSNPAPYTVSNSTTPPTGSPNLYIGTQDSVNTFYVQLEQRTGLCEPYKLAKEMGVQLTDPDRERVPTFTLGVPSVSPLEMAEAYATVAARGKHCDAKPIYKILNNQGKLFKKYSPTCKQVVSNYTADTVNDILRGVMEPGGFGSGIAIDKQSAGKTGTTQDNKSVWFDGYTPAIATITMVAGANRFGTPISLNYQSVGGVNRGKAFGSTVAGPIWGDAMRAIQDLLPDKTFTPPGQAPDTTGPSTGVPNVVGQTTDQAMATLRAAGFSPVVGSAVDSRRAVGVIAGENPNGGTSAPQGGTVTIYPSNGANYTQ